MAGSSGRDADSATTSGECVLIDGLSAERVLYPDRVTRTASSRCSTSCSAGCVLNRPARDVILVTISQRGSGAPSRVPGFLRHIIRGLEN